MINKNFRKVLPVILTAALLGGCSTLSKNNQKQFYQTWSIRKVQLANLKNWEARGSVGIKNKHTNDLAKFIWQENSTNFTLKVTSTFGLGGVTILGDKDHVILLEGATKTITAKSAEDLMYQELGWSLPITNLSKWILGLPAENAPYKPQFDQFKQLTDLCQQGWMIKYTDYQEINNFTLPTKIILINHDLQIKLAITRWKIKS